MLSRCWCDFQRTPFFGYYNVTEWEIDSLKEAAQAANITSALNILQEPEVLDDQKTPNLEHSQTVSHHKRVWRWISKLRENLENRLPGLRAKVGPGSTEGGSEWKEKEQNTPKVDDSSGRQESLPWLRWKYDLRPYGIDLIVDLGWRRSD